MNTGLTICGGVLEVVGFTFVAYELYRIQRREFGTPEFVKKLYYRLRRLLRRPIDHTINVGAAVTIAGGGEVTTRMRRGPGSTTEERLEAIERNIELFEGEVDEFKAEHDSRLHNLRADLEGLHRELNERHAETEEKRKAALRSSVAIQAGGTLLFLLGTVLSVLGNVL